MDFKFRPRRIDRRRLRLTATNDIFNHGFTGDPVAKILTAVETSSVNGNNRNTPPFSRRFTGSFQIIAD